MLYNRDFIVRIVSIRKGFLLRIIKSKSTLTRVEYFYKEVNFAWKKKVLMNCQEDFIQTFTRQLVGMKLERGGGSPIMTGLNTCPAGSGI